jgi:hypothetical protein
MEASQASKNVDSSPKKEIKPKKIKSLFHK